MYSIRKMEDADLAIIYEIYVYYVKNSTAIFDIEPLSFEAFSHNMKAIAKDYPFYVACHEGKLIGYAYVHPAFSKEAYRYCVELTIYFEKGPHYGLAQKILDVVETDCRKAGMRWIIACITDTNQGSIAFHKRNHYEYNGALPSCGFKFNQFHGVLWLCKDLMKEKKGYYKAEDASIIGSVTLEKDVNIWHKTTIRGDTDTISIDEGTNVQELCSLHVDAGYPLKIGKNVTIGHGALLHGATIEDEVLIGMGAIILNGAHIESHCIVGAGALIPENMHIPSGSLVVGVPAKIIKQVTDKQIEEIKENAREYITLAKEELEAV